MATTREEKIVQLIFSCCGCTPKIKLNNEWQMFIIFKKVFVVDGIISLTILYWVENFKLYNKYFRLFAKKVNIVTKTVSIIIFVLWLDEVWKNQELIKLGKLIHKNKVWFGKILQRAIIEKVT